MKTTSFCFLLAMCPVCIVASDTRPNVIVFLADDMGWGDLSSSGNTNLLTPHIDSLGRDGASFSNFYVCPVCAPTRAEFLTARYYPKTGVSGVSEGQGRMNPDEVTIADVFHHQGYATGAFGKWHNGTQPPYHPCDRGFDEFYGFTSGHWGHYFSPPLDHNRQHVRGEGFIVDDITNRAIRFIRKNSERPFFCYVPFNTPHSPMMVPDRFYEKFDNVDVQMKHRDPEREDPMMTRAALALCENLDWNVGRVLSTLDDLDLAAETIVVFFSDNGPNSWRWNGGMKGRKGSIDEGGLKSPCMIRWPGEIPAGKVVQSVSGGIDLFPTLVELAGLKQQLSGIDGISLKRLLNGEQQDWPSRRLFSIRKNKVSIRTGTFRFHSEDGLFDLSTDPGQTRDVSSKYPTLVRSLKAAAAKYGKDMQIAFAENKDRPFTVGYGTRTTLPARDGRPHGNIRRSSKAPNNSFFVDWLNEDDFVTWDIDVGATAEYRITVYYTLPEANVGCLLHVGVSDDREVSVRLTDAFDPPLYDKAKERVANSHYIVKDFNPVSAGVLKLSRGRQTLRLSVSQIAGRRAMDIHSIDIDRLHRVQTRLK